VSGAEWGDVRRLALALVVAGPAAAQVVVTAPPFQTSSTVVVTVPGSTFMVNMQPDEQWLFVTSGELSSDVGGAELHVTTGIPGDDYAYVAAPAGRTVPFLYFDFYMPAAAMGFGLNGVVRQLQAGGNAAVKDLTIIGFKVTTLDPVEDFAVPFSQGPFTLETLNSVDPGRRLILSAGTTYCDAGFTSLQVQLPTGAVAPPGDGVDQLSAPVDLPASYFIAAVDTPPTALDTFTIATMRGGGEIYFSRMAAFGLSDTLQVSSVGPVALGIAAQTVLTQTLGPVTPGRPYVALYLVNLAFGASGAAHLDFLGDGVTVGSVDPIFIGSTALPVGVWRVVTPTAATYGVAISGSSTVAVNAWGGFVALVGPLDVSGTYAADAGMDAGVAGDGGTMMSGDAGSDAGSAEADGGSTQAPGGGPAQTSDAGVADGGLDLTPKPFRASCGCSVSPMTLPLLLIALARSGRVRGRRRL
jgi:hypothetical protein